MVLGIRHLEKSNIHKNRTVVIVSVNLGSFFYIETQSILDSIII